MTYRIQVPASAELRGLDAPAGARGTLDPHGVSSLSRPWSFPPCPATQGWKGAAGGVLSCCFLRGTLATGHATHRASRERARCGGGRLLCWLWAPSITPPTSGCESAGSRQGSLLLSAAPQWLRHMAAATALEPSEIRARFPTSREIPAGRPHQKRCQRSPAPTRPASQASR